MVDSESEKRLRETLVTEGETSEEAGDLKGQRASTGSEAMEVIETDLDKLVKLFGKPLTGKAGKRASVVLQLEQMYVTFTDEKLKQSLIYAARNTDSENDLLFNGPVAFVIDDTAISKLPDELVTKIHKWSRINDDQTLTRSDVSAYLASELLDEDGYRDGEQEGMSQTSVKRLLKERSGFTNIMGSKYPHEW